MADIELHLDAQILAAKKAYDDADGDWPKQRELGKAIDKLVLQRGAQIAGEPVGVLQYTANNSGGSWWLSAEDWRAMAADGWNVHWITGDGLGESKGSNYGTLLDALTPSEESEHTWLGAPAKSAAIATADPNGAVARWEQITGQDAGAEGCNCCGEPHSFTFIDPNGEERYSEVIVTSRFGGF